MTPSARIKATVLAKEFEGCKLAAYRCPAGLWTIGWGHLLSPDPEADFAGKTITQAEADELLEQDLTRAYTQMTPLVTVSLTDGQTAALTDFVFNLGAGAFKTSTLRAVINRGWHDQVPEQLRRWVYSKKQKLAGLVRRREAEIELYLSG